MRFSQNNSHLFFTGIVLGGCVLALAGCVNPFETKEEPVKEPPFIPAPEAPAVEAKAEIPALYVGAFADMMEYGDQGSHHPKLVEAVAHAIRIGVLKPSGIQDRFNAQNPVNFGEFRTWALAYQAAAAGTTKLKPEAPSQGNNKPRELASIVSRTDALDSPMNPVKLTLLPEVPRFDEHTLAANRPLTREELCALYVVLAEKQELARRLTPEVIEQTAPGEGSLNGDESLSMFKDYPAISSWAKPYVAIAYQNFVLQKVFNLTGTRLTIEDGFNPQAPINREESILMLNLLYGHVKNPAPVLSSKDEVSVKPQNSKGDPGLRSAYMPTNRQPVAPPFKNIKTLSESGPAGSRSLQQTKQAE